jgi:hypothetical protein
MFPIVDRRLGWMVVAAQLRALVGKLTNSEDQALVEKRLGQLLSGIERERALHAHLSTDRVGPREATWTNIVCVRHEPSNGNSSGILNNDRQKLIR